MGTTEYRKIVNQLGTETPQTTNDSLEDVLYALGLVKSAFDSANTVLLSVEQNTRTGIAEEAIQYLVALYLQNEHNLVYNTGVLLTLLDIQPPATESVQQSIEEGMLPLIAAKYTDIRLDRLPALVEDPLSTLKAEYLSSGPLTADELNDLERRMFPWLAELFGWLGFRIALSENQLSLLQQGDIPSVTTISRSLLVWKELSDPPGSLLAGGLKEVASVAFEIALANSAHGLGLVVFPYGSNQFSEELDDWRVDVSLSAETDGFLIHSGGIEPLQLTPTTSEVTATGKIEKRLDPSQRPGYVLGPEGGTRVELNNVGIEGELTAAPGEVSVDVSVSTAESLFVIAATDADGLLTSVLPEASIRAPFALAGGWNSARGTYVRGGGTLKANIPVHKSIGNAFSADSVTIEIKPAENSLSIYLTSAVGLKLGPVLATIGGMGLRSSLSFPDDYDGNLGQLDLDIGFEWPSRIGISIDSGAVTGGGYLGFDADNEQYEGVLKLAFGNITVNAIGLLTTRLPGGGEGFSLLVIISGEFPPIQLGMGVTLNGLGGLVGVNRQTQFDVLRSGLRKGSMKSILFPKDPLRNAPQLISDLRNIFPPKSDRHVVGPMARFAWGTPPIVTADVGILLELPAPVRLAILGRISAVLPAEEGALIELNMDALGVIDFGEETASVDASLYDSRIVTLVLTGDMALRSSWGDDPGFGLSIGGFNPRFTPPPDFPELRRLALNLCPGNNPRLRLAGYFAVTSNTVQVGANIDLYAGAGKFSISGYLGFDALFQFDPFRFIVDIAAGVALKLGSSTLMSISLTGMLSGPAPWHVKGSAKFKILFVSFSVSIEKKFGARADPPTLPPPDVLGELKAALEKDGNWTAQLPDDNRTLVSLRDIDATDGEVLAHPLGTLGVRQRVVPLTVAIDKYGNATPRDYNTFEISDVTTVETELSDDETALREQFAPAQYFELTDDEKLSRPGFERLPAGRRIGNDLLTYGGESNPAMITTTTLEYESTFVDKSLDVFVEKLESLGLPVHVADALANTSAVAQAETRTTGQKTFAGPDQRIEISDTSYVVASATDLTREGLISGEGATRIEAEQALQAHLREHPEAEGDLQIVAAHEVAENGADA
ncbi:DUF6603 domain-containing protein [Haladaptatus sp. NG-WS-4]